jgi:peptidoglycan DL-endopeptidase CwlO
MQNALQAAGRNRFLAVVSGAAVAAAVTCGATAIEPAYADTAAEIQAQADAALQELNSMEETANGYYSDYVQSLSDYESAASSRDAAKAEVEQINGEISDIQDRLGDRARSMYRSGTSSFLDLLLGSTSFSEFSTNWDLLGRMNQNDADLVQESKDLREKATAKQQEYETQAATAQAKANEASEQYQKAQDAITEMQSVYNSLSEEAQAAYAAEQAAAQAAAQASYDQYYAQAAAEYGVTYNSDGSITDSSGQTYSSASAYASATGNDIVDRARSMIGSSYVWGGTGGSWGGFDCSGLVSYAITGQEGTRLGTTNTFMGYEQSSSPSVGDLVVNSGHVAVVSGVDSNGNITSIIHAVNESQGVAETGMSGYFSDGDYTVVHSS